MSQTYIALDIETTGLDPRQNEIVEVAAVRFQDEAVRDTFHALVRPTRPLPRYIQWLCGLSPQEVAAAPPFSEVAPGLAAFLGTTTLVGHNLAFDLGFLAAGGVSLANPYYDTWELATVVLPSLSDHSLKTVAAHFGLSLTAHHRALPDALAVKDAFLRLAEKATALRSSLLKEMLRRPRRPFAAPGPLASLPALSPPAPPLTPHPTRKEVPDLAPYLAPAGLLSQAFPSYEHRPEQATMAEAVARAFNQGQHLVVEAGTGTGKSVAYLLPALLFALENGRPVVVSTHTINLQEQLLRKDIPALIPLLAERPRVVALKGRENYVCPWCLERERQRLMEPDEARFFTRLDVWLPGTASGDRAELRLTPPEAAFWRLVSAQTEACLAGECSHLHRGACFLQRAREAAKAAHLIVVNHALLLADLASPILPSYRHLIVDEAHHLEDEATRQQGYRLDKGDFQELFRRLEALHRPDKAGKALAKRGEEAAAELFARLSRFLADHASPGARDVALGRGLRAQPGWWHIEEAWENLNLVLQDGQRWVEGLADQGWEHAATLFRCQELRQQGNGLLASSEPGTVAWASLGGALNLSKGDDVSLAAAPLEVSHYLAENLFGPRETVVLTGATLTTEGSFRFLKGRLGADAAEELVLGTPFDYRSALLYIPSDIPEPAQPGYDEAVTTALVEIARAAQGRTMVLFTSHAALRSAHARLGPRLEADGLMVLGQGLEGSPRQLLSLFQERPRSVLLGTASFWEGVDVEGEALKVLVMARLPFPVPTDPLFAARSQLFDDPFNEYALPQAVLRFKQGFGRLIRRRTDRGVVVVLDRRLQSRSYASAFLDSLPPCVVKKGPWRELPSLIRSWLAETA